MSFRRRSALVVAALVALGACATSDPFVRTRGAQEIVTVDTTVVDSPFEATTDPAEEPVPDTEPTTEPDPTAEPIPDAGGPEFTLPEDKERRDYDDFLEAAINDIENYWRNEYPIVYGEEYTELAGGVHPMNPGDVLTPGCGEPNTDYSMVEGNAFYCGIGDFIAYDDSSLIPFLDRELGRISIGVVMAHEWGHAIQFRIGWDTVEVIDLEQQADCFAGAWLAHVARGESAEITFSEEDLKGALQAMIFVRDEPGTTSGVAGDPLAHGSAFDRVGAFEDGFRNGAAQCATYRENPPPTIQFGYANSTISIEDQENAPLSCDNSPNPECKDIFALIQDALNVYWPPLISGMPSPTVGFFTDDPATVCDPLPASIFQVAFFCPANATVWIDEALAADIWNRPELGDFGVAYVIATAWAETALATLGDPVSGETKALAADCLVGAFTRSSLPELFNGVPDDDRPEGSAYLSPGDLDEAVSTAILAGDDTEDTDENGTPFEKIEQFRRGVLGDYAACQAAFGL